MNPIKKVFKCPCLTDLINNGGSARQKSDDSLEALLSDAEIKRWMEESGNMTTD